MTSIDLIPINTLHFYNIHKGQATEKCWLGKAIAWILNYIGYQTYLDVFTSAIRKGHTSLPLSQSHDVSYPKTENRFKNLINKLLSLNDKLLVKDVLSLSQVKEAPIILAPAGCATEVIRKVTKGDLPEALLKDYRRQSWYIGKNLYFEFLTNEKVIFPDHIQESDKDSYMDRLLEIIRSQYGHLSHYNTIITFISQTIGNAFFTGQGDLDASVINRTFYKKVGDHQCEFPSDSPLVGRFNFKLIFSEDFKSITVDASWKIQCRDHQEAERSQFNITTSITWDLEKDELIFYPMNSIQPNDCTADEFIKILPILLK